MYVLNIVINTLQAKFRIHYIFFFIILALLNQNFAIIKDKEILWQERFELMIFGSYELFQFL